MLRLIMEEFGCSRGWFWLSLRDPQLALGAALGLVLSRWGVEGLLALIPPDVSWVGEVAD